MTSPSIKPFDSCPKHLYIHWPFCKNKCHYCDFVAFEKHTAYIKQYHDALCREFDSFGSQFSSVQKPKIDTIFVGGGTPSLWPLALIQEGFTKLRTYFDLNELKESTIEVNPGGITRDHFKTWQSIGINRVSIGVQILEENILAGLNRHQKTADVKELLSLAPQYIKNISVDLIIGLPGVTDEVWWETLKYVVAQPITHISIYFLTIHELTPLYFRIKKGNLSVPCEDATVELFEKTVIFLQQEGFLHYEISNFAKPGFESLHNQAYWDRRPYKGFGIGAASFDGKLRIVNVKNLLRYMDALAYPVNASSHDHLWYQVETLTMNQEFLEVIMLGLRQQKGINMQQVIGYLTSEELLKFYARVDLLKKRFLITEQDGRIALTERGMILENEVIAHLF